MFNVILGRSCIPRNGNSGYSFGLNPSVTANTHLELFSAYGLNGIHQDLRRTIPNSRRLSTKLEASAGLGILIRDGMFPLSCALIEQFLSPAIQLVLYDKRFREGLAQKRCEVEHLNYAVGSALLRFSIRIEALHLGISDREIIAGFERTAFQLSRERLNNYAITEIGEKYNQGMDLAEAMNSAISACSNLLVQLGLRQDMTDCFQSLAVMRNGSALVNHAGAEKRPG